MFGFKELFTNVFGNVAYDLAKWTVWVLIKVWPYERHMKTETKKPQNSSWQTLWPSVLIILFFLGLGFSLGYITFHQTTPSSPQPSNPQVRSVAGLTLIGFSDDDANSVQVAFIENNAGKVAKDQGDWPQAAKEFEDSYARYFKFSTSNAECRAHAAIEASSLGTVYQHLQPPKDSRLAYDASIELSMPNANKLNQEIKPTTQQ